MNPTVVVSDIEKEGGSIACNVQKMRHSHKAWNEKFKHKK